MKKLLADHGEKIGIAVSLALLGLFALGAFGSTGVPDNQTPEALKTLSNAAKEHIEQGKRPEPEEAAEVSFVNQLEPDTQMLASADYKLREIDRPVFAPLNKRPDPTLLALERLEGWGGFGGIAVQLDEDDEEALSSGGGYGGRSSRSGASSKTRGTRGSATRGARGSSTRSGSTGRSGSTARSGATGRGGATSSGGYGPLGGTGGRGARGGRGGEGGGYDDYGSGSAEAGLVQIPQDLILPGASPSGGKVEPRFWTVVTGLIPKADQAEIYERAFQNTMGVNAQSAGGGYGGSSGGYGSSGSSGGADSTRTGPMPAYFFFDIARAEVLPDGTLGKWTALDPLQGEYGWQDRFTWMQTAELPDLVYPYFKHNYLTWPLPPLVGRDWGAEVVNSQMEIVTPEDLEEAGYGKTGSSSSKSSRSSRTSSSSSSSSAAMGEAPDPGSFIPDEDEEEEQFDVSHQLFRFFDFTVEPGKSYSYRVRLSLVNPNFNQEPQYLMNDKSAKVKFVKTPWTDACDPIYVPKPHQVYTVKAKAPAKTNADPTAEIGLLSWKVVPELGPIQASHKIDNLDLGGVANAETKVEVIDYVARTIEEVEEFKFLSNMQLVDLHGAQDPKAKGGGGLAAAKKGPIPETLFLDQDGNLIVSRGTADANKDYEEYKLMMEEVMWAPEPEVMDDGYGGGGGGGYPSGGGGYPSSSGGGGRPQRPRGGGPLNR